MKRSCVWLALWAVVIGSVPVTAHSEPKRASKGQHRERRQAASAPSDAARAAPEFALGPTDFESLAECERSVRERQKHPAPTGTVNVASWAIRWLTRKAATDGGAIGPAGESTRQLACALVALEAPIVAIQGVPREPAAAAHWERVMAHMNELTGATWRSAFDACPGKGQRHVGLLYREDRVEVADAAAVAYVNPTLRTCGDGLRPGFGGYVRIDHAVDFYLLSLHLHPGNRVQNQARRIASVLGVDPAFRDASKKYADKDMIVGGDFNVGGCGDGPKGCLRPITEEIEQEQIVKVASDLEHGPFRTVRSEPPGTTFEPFANSVATRSLDFFLVSQSMSEVPPNARARVFGPCAIAEGRTPLAHGLFAAFSDHCPVVLAVETRDDDATTPTPAEKSR